MTNRAKVVGVYHRNIENAQEILEAMKDTHFDVLMKAEPNNLYDPNAIAVYVCGQKFGYISHNDISSIPLRTAHLAQADEILLAETNRTVDVEHGCFEVEFAADHVYRISAFEETGRDWEGWRPTCFAPQPSLTLVNDIQADLDMLIHLGHIDNKTKLLRIWSEGLRTIGCIPLWREAQQDLARLIADYENSTSEYKKEAAQELRHMVTAIGSPKHRQDSVEVWWKKILESEEIQRFVLIHSQVAVTDIISDIEKLPGNLFLLLNDRVALFSSIYYRRIPLQQWSDLVRLLVLHDIMESGNITTGRTNYFLGEKTEYIENQYEHK